MTNPTNPTNPYFIGLVQSMVSSAQASVGDDSSPLASRLAAGGARNRATAQKSLELLIMLQEKTNGNLNETERESLHQAILTVQSLLTPSSALN